MNKVHQSLTPTAATTTTKDNINKTLPDPPVPRIHPRTSVEDTSIRLPGNSGDIWPKSPGKLRPPKKSPPCAGLPAIPVTAPLPPPPLPSVWASRALPLPVRRPAKLMGLRRQGIPLACAAGSTSSKSPMPPGSLQRCCVGSAPSAGWLLVGLPPLASLLPPLLFRPKLRLQPAGTAEGAPEVERRAKGVGEEELRG
eukprot:1141469-Pelagomonas_calceolata.AAC.8